MQTTVRKWGNSLAIRIPGALARSAGLGGGTPVSLSLEQGRIILEPQQRPQYKLEALLKGVKKGNLHSESEVRF